jgi:hypothetical protein
VLSILFSDDYSRIQFNETRFKIPAIAGKEQHEFWKTTHVHCALFRAVLANFVSEFLLALRRERWPL